MYSLSARLLVLVSLLLVVFFGLTIAALDMVFRDLSKRGLRELLDAQAVALIAASDDDEQGAVRPSRPLAEPRFSQPGSGLYGEIRTVEGQLLWQSASALGSEVNFGLPVTAGQRLQEKVTIENANGPGQTAHLIVLSVGIHWELQPGTDRDLVFSVATDLAPYKAQLHRFRVQLFGWFSVLMVLVLLALAFLLRIVLAPLRRIEREIGEVEVGEREQLGTELPRELVGLATNMNALLTSERKRVERYRNTLGNLAHSLKTPLAVIRATLSSRRSGGPTAVTDEQIDRQVDHMDTIVQHQLRRASASGTSLGRVAVEVKPVLMELRAALTKVYAQKDLLIEVDAPDGAVFTGERSDLFEIAGNLLDNASKWCRGHVRVTTARSQDAHGRSQLQLTVEDDGAGIAPADRARILERGVRVDENVAGQGLGLSMVREAVELYGGQLQIGDSPLGGARISLVLPGR